ncbi:hypothetical protein [Syntrophomonas wolfei]|jgi:hypothetical protein|uniref:hypothetical protein n=1 Tax=Syntrophomonas wolfei TaxID=863 RepID=UPI0023F10A78|nr:hypothetical protein [Syntrophomonas wolfei]
MTIKRSKVTSIVLTALLLMSVFAMPAFAWDYTGYASKSTSTSYGTLTGQFNLHADDPNYYYFEESGWVDSSQTFSSMYAEYSIHNYYSGARLDGKSAVAYNDNAVYFDDFIYKPSSPPFTIYGVVEVRHTTTYTVRPTLTGTYGGL